jgi:exodeoxyribonuclease VII small subunit
MLEDGNLPLQKRVDKFEEGIKLLKQCETELEDVEFTIRKVLDEEGW